MQKEFSKEYMYANCGCYDENDYKELKACSFMQKEVITIQDIINSEIPLKDKFWFVIKKTGLTTQQKQQIAIDCAEIVLPIYEKRYLNDSRVRNCIEVTKQYLAGHISLTTPIEKRRADAAYAAAAAYDAADAAYAAAAYADAADAAYAAAAYADAADAAYAAAAAAAAYAAYAAAYAAYAAAYADAAIKNQLFYYLQQIPGKY